MRIIYDGACPFCNNYIKFLRLQKNVSDYIELINARERDDIRNIYKQKGYDLNEGIVVDYNSEIYFGADAIHLLGLLSSGDNLFSIFNKLIFKSKFLSRTLYPLLKIGRFVTLKILRLRPL